MAAEAAWQCIFQIGGTLATVGNLNSAELQISGTTLDITSLGNQWKSMLGGLVGYTLKIAGMLDMSDAQQATLQGDIITTPGAVVAWAIFPKGTGATTKYAGNAIIKGFDAKFDVAKEETVSFDFDGTGAITFTA